MLHKSLRDFLIDNEVIPNASKRGKIEYGKIVQDTETPFIWYQRSSHNQDVNINGRMLLATTEFDVEVVHTDPMETQTLADSIRTLLHGYQGAMGDDTVLAMFVTDQSDDYENFNVMTDDGFYIVAFKVQIQT
ncbi:MAG: hypothetical protein HY253_12895 [Burkholderiales bacterium]|nr:hypothetical protein [Burkholderiales bacterium]